MAETFTLEDDDLEGETFVLEDTEGDTFTLDEEPAPKIPRAPLAPEQEAHRADLEARGLPLPPDLRRPAAKQGEPGFFERPFTPVGDALTGFVDGMIDAFTENPPTGVSPEDKKKLRDMGVFASADSDFGLWNVGRNVAEAGLDVATVAGQTALSVLDGAFVKGPANAMAESARNFGLDERGADQLRREAEGFFFLAGLATMAHPEGAAAAQARSQLRTQMDKTINKVTQNAARTKAEDMRAKLRAEAEAELDRIELEAAKRRFEQPSASQVTAKSRFDKKAQLTTDFVDAKRGIKILEQESQKGVKRKARDLSTYHSVRVTAGIQGIMDGAHKFGAPKIVREKITRNGRTVIKEGTVFDESTRGLNDILAPIANQVEEFNLYAAARRQKSIALQIAGGERAPIPLEFTGPQMRNALLLGEVNPKFKAVFRDYQKFNRKMLDFAEDSGVLSAEQKARFLKAGQNYVPYYRLIEEDGNIKVRGNPLKKLKGGKEPINDIVNNMARNTNMWIHAAVQNRAKRELYGLIEREGATDLAAKLKPTVGRSFAKPVDDEIRGLLKDAGLTGDDSLIEVLTFNKRLADDIDVVYRDGQRVMYKIEDPVMLKAVHDMSPKPLNAAVRMIGAPASEVLKAGVTKYNPVFGVINYARDSLSAVMNSRAGFIPVWDNAAGLVSRITQDRFYKDFLANGGGFSTFTTAPMNQNLARMYTRAGIKPQNVLNTPGKLARSVAKFNQVLEEANRVGEFRRSRLKGRGLQESAFNARSVSTDFAVRGAGEFTRNFMATVPFLNARLQGLDEMGRALGRNPHKVALKGLTMITLPSLALRYVNENDPHFEALPDYVKDFHWVIPDITSDKEGDFLLIPKPFEWGAIFGTVPENMFDLSKTGNWKRFGNALKRMAFDTFSVQEPQIVRPLAELARNRTFGDRPIVPADLENVLKSEQFGPDTSETMRELAAGYKEATGFEPPLGAEELEHLVRGYFGTLGTYALNVADWTVERAGGETDPAMRIDEVVLMDRITRKQPQFASQFQTDFYDLLTKTRQITETFNKVTNAGREPDLNKRQENLKSLYSSLDSFARTLANMKKAQDRIWEDKSLTAEEKRRKVDGIQVQINEALRERMKAIPEDVARQQGLQIPRAE